MKIINYFLTGISVLSIATLTSCIDDKYDLGNIDTTARFQTKQLMVPINIDHVTLEQVLEINDESEIVKTHDKDNKLFYAIKKEGNFTSENIIVDEFTIPIPVMNPADYVLELEDLRQVEGFMKITGEPVAYYEINEKNSIVVPFESQDIGIDKSIKQIDKLGVTTKFTIKIKVNGLSQKTLGNTKLTGLNIQFPKGMDISSNKGTYHSETGILDLTNETIQLDHIGELDMVLNVDGITNNSEWIHFDHDNHLVHIAGNIKIIRGKVSVYEDTDLANNIKFHSEYSLDDIKVHSFNGKVEYQLDNLAIDPIKMENIPDLLIKSGTKIELENPQIYLSLNNPLYEYATLFQTDLQMTAIRNGTRMTYRPDDGTFKTKSAKADDNEFLLSPVIPPFYYEGFTNPQHVCFSSLKYVFSELDGIPDSILIDAIDPTMVTSMHVSNFKLGEDYGPIVGEYVFFAPLQLSEESLIMYTDTIDGWNEDVDDITIEKMKVSFDASIDVPFDTELTLRPIDNTGTAIPGVACNTVMLPAEAKEHHVEMTIDGIVSHLDGIILQARLANKNNNSILTPEMLLDVKNCKATVTGYYEKEL